jgi:O-glycosyl hydrolase
MRSQLAYTAHALDLLLTSAAAQLLKHLQVDKLTADAVELKAGYDKLSVDSSEQKAQVRGFG